MRPLQQILQELEKCRKEMEGLSDADIVVMYNKNDLDEIYPMEFLQNDLGLEKWEGFSTCALTGENLEDALISMLRKLTEKLKLQGFYVE